MCTDQGWSVLELRVGSGQGALGAAQMGLNCLGELCMEVGSLGLGDGDLWKVLSRGRVGMIPQPYSKLHADGSRVGGMLVGRLILGESVGEGRLECESETEKAGDGSRVRGRGVQILVLVSSACALVRGSQGLSWSLGWGAASVAGEAGVQFIGLCCHSQSGLLCFRFLEVYSPSLCIKPAHL